MRAGGAWLATAMALLAGGCLEASSVVCADGRICPAGLVCSDANRRCVSPEQLDACQGKADLDPCEVGGGSGQCQGGACLLAICGDGRVEGTETCDGDNLGEGTDCLDIGYYDQQPLTCDASCRLDESVCTGGKCGDEVVNGPELCDGLPPEEIQCVDLGYSVGALPICTARCEPDTALCHRIGIDRISMPAFDPAQDLIGSGPDDLWAIARAGGDGGPLFHNAGVAWLRVFDEAYSVWAIGRDDVYATVRREDRITLQHFDGSGWTVIEGVTPGASQRVRAGGPDDIDLVGGGPVAPMHFDGESWTAIGDLPSRPVVDMWDDPTSETIYLVLYDAPGNLLYRFDGAGWELVEHGLDRVDAVWGSGADDVWIGGRSQLGYSQGGSFEIIDNALPIGGDISSLSGTSSDDIYAVTTEDLGVSGGSQLIGRLAAFDGKAWSAVAQLPGVREVWAADPDAIFMAGNAGSTFRYHGSLWRPELQLVLGPGNVGAGFVERDDEIFAAVNFSAFSDSGLVHRFDGTSWDAGSPVSAAALNGLFLSGPAVYAVGDDGLFRLGAGDSWSQVDVAGGAEPSLQDGWSNGPDARFVVGSNLFYDLGAGWSEADRAAPCLGGMAGVWGSDASDVFAVGGCGLIMHFDGEKWTGMDSGSDVALSDVWGRAGDDVYAVGAAGTVLHYDGANWAPMPELPIPADLRSISGTADELFATGSQGLIFHFDGQSWSQLEPDAVVDLIIEVAASGHEVVFMSMFGTDVSVLRLLQTTDWRAP